MIKNLTTRSGYDNLRHDIINEKHKMISKNQPNTITTFKNQILCIISFYNDAILKTKQTIIALLPFYLVSNQ